MATSYVDQVDGVGSSPTPVDAITEAGETVGLKAPCRVATTANISLSGLQTIDGVVLVADDRVLVKDQTDESLNGIYIAASGAWSRAVDFDSNRDAAKGTRVNVTDGTTYEGAEFRVSSDNPVEVGTDDITFERTGNGDVVGPASSTNNGFAKWDGTTGDLLKNSAAVISLADGGFGWTWSAPGADRIPFYDFSALGFAFLTLGPGLAISGTTLSPDTATTSRPGQVSELATDAETQALADTSRVVTPSNLAAMVATQADQETATSNARFVSPGRQHNHPGHPKCWAWVTQSGGTPTLSTSYNITSITDTGSGQLTITIATDFSSANWLALPMVADSNSRMPVIGNIAAGSVRIDLYTDGGSLTDPSIGWGLAGFGDQA